MAIVAESEKTLASPVCGSGELTLVVSRTEDLTDRIRMIEFRALNDEDLPAWEPGAYISFPVELPAGPGDVMAAGEGI